EFLGHIITPDGIGMDPLKVQAIQDWHPPTSVKELQVFLGFANYYRKFIPNYSKLALPLTKLLSKKVPTWNWNDTAQQAFDSLKTHFCSSPVLQHSDPSKPFILETDASDYAIGAVLSQKSADDQLHPIAYFSRKLTSSEINYEIYDKELLAIIDSLSYWRHLLIATNDPVLIYSDHKNLEYFTTTKRLNRRQARWSLFLADFHFQITYRAGRLQGKPDALSRQPALKPKGGDSEYEIQQQTLLKPQQFVFATNELPPTVIEIKNAYLNDETAKHLQKAIDEKTDPTVQIKYGIIYKNNKIYVPESMRIQILQQRHDSKLAGH
ncbi:hypothetical protein, partial, partial [Absidia glauca]